MILVEMLRGTAAFGAFLFPGWLVARAFHVPHPLLGGFIGCVVAMVTLTISLDALGASLDLISVGAAWAVLSVGAVMIWWRQGRVSVGGYIQSPSSWRENWPLILPLIPAVCVVGYRAIFQPLFGVDTIFRWNFLAEQMLTRKSLGFYPPVTATDYAIYSWPDGIAPTVSTLYFWIYAVAGSTRTWLTAPVVILQFILLVIAGHAVARTTFSARAAAFSCALIACSPLLMWSTTMGQETGLIAIAFTALLVYLPKTRDDGTSGRILFAALAASLGALSREYGLIVPLLGCGLCLARRLLPRTTVTFMAMTAVGVLPWYARNWIVTGNPLFNFALGDIFPVNEVHRWLSESYGAEHGLGKFPPEAARLIVTNCCAALIGLFAGICLLFRQGGALLLVAAIASVLWLASIRHTAAGFLYSLRVLNPALVMGSILGGAALAKLIPGTRSLKGATFGLCIFASDAALRTLTLPGNAYRIPPTEWLSAGRAVHDYHQRPIYDELVRVAGNMRMLVLGPNAQLSIRGAQTLPLWSPEVRFLFDPQLSPAEMGQRLGNANVGFVVLNTGSINESFLRRSALFRNPSGVLNPVWSDADMMLLRVGP